MVYPHDQTGVSTFWRLYSNLVSDLTKPDFVFGAVLKNLAVISFLRHEFAQMKSFAKKYCLLTSVRYPLADSETNDLVELL